MDEIAEKLIDAAIKEGGSHRPNRLSTKTIAKESGVSEATLFDRFATKKILLDACEDECWKRLIASGKECQQNSATFKEYFLSGIAYMQNHVEENGFLLNYGCVYPRVSQSVDYKKRCKVVCSEGAELLKKYFPNFGDEEMFYYSRHFLRVLISFSRRLINGWLPDDKDVLETEALLLCEGYDGLRYEKYRVK
jgi:AcrR family transcriptional regulator